MLTPKCPPRDFRVMARANSTKKRLYRFKRNPRGGNRAEFRGEVGTLDRAQKYCYINDLMWLCCEAEANEAQQPNSLIFGKIQGISSKSGH